MQTSYRFSAPGRTEISGNHTDHQHGCVLAAAVDLETTAEVTLRPDSIIRVASEGYAPVEIDLNDLSVHAEEKIRPPRSCAALLRRLRSAAVSCTALTRLSARPSCPAPVCRPPPHSRF